MSYLRLTVEGERRLARAFSDLDTERRTLMAALKQSPRANNVNNGRS